MTRKRKRLLELLESMKLGIGFWKKKLKDKILVLMPCSIGFFGALLFLIVILIDLPLFDFQIGLWGK